MKQAKTQFADRMLFVLGGARIVSTNSIIPVAPVHYVHRDQCALACNPAPADSNRPADGALLWAT